jgi:inosine-uridine nucleoside N-ribohydrolase
MRLSILSLLFVATAAVAAGQPVRPDQKIRVLLDTDANNELDDQHAIAYMLFSGDRFDVEGITVNRTQGGGGIDEQHAEALRIVKLSGLSGRVPVLKGADGSFTQIAPRVGTASFDGSDAVNFIIEKAHEAGSGRLVLIPVGKLTNVALALKKDPAIAAKVRIVWLGSNYPEPGEYNQENDEPAVQYVLDTDVPFEIALVRYGTPSGTDAVRVTRDEIRARMAGKGPRASEAVVGRHGGEFRTFGDYSIDLFEHIKLSGNPPSRALYDMAAVAIVKDGSWARSRRIPAPQLVKGKWVERPNNTRTIAIWENFDRGRILADFYRVMDAPRLAGELAPVVHEPGRGGPHAVSGVPAVTPVVLRSTHQGDTGWPASHTAGGRDRGRTGELHLPAGLSQPPKTLRLSKDVLRDKIKGGWAGQTIGVTFGGPTEFRYRGTMIDDYTPIAWHAGLLKESYERSMGLYDDLYVDLTFVDVIEKQGLDATPEQFAEAFARAGYQLWHANQMARYNILRGLKPPASGHWRNNPEADDIDFQIEADFIGLMAPGMPRTASEFADRVGHIMNSGDGWYGGVYMAAMYTLAFTSGDVGYVVSEGLKAIPAGTRFRDTIEAVIGLHRQYPDDWKRAWFEIQRKWADDVGCAEGVFGAFNIDARLNAAYVVLGLLYGQGDMTRTISIATRAGQDSDCNPASAAGILGVMLGYAQIPAFWKQGLAAVEPMKFQHANLSLDDAYGLTFKHALELIRRNGGHVADDHVVVAVQPVAAVRVEQNFEGHHPTAEITLRRRFADETTFAFEGIGFVVQGNVRSESGTDQVIAVDVFIDDRLAETVELPTNVARRRYIPFWKYELPEGKHAVRLKVRTPVPEATVWIERVIVYGSKPVRPPV